jgi:hypothetical protein
MFAVPVLTRTRVRAAYVVAVVVDVLQFALGPFGWAFTDQALDVVAMVAIAGLIGFHPLLLPTFFLELLPIADVLPTWTACVALVVMLRRTPPRPPVPPAKGPVIDV